MAKREFIDKSEVMMFTGDIFECQCDMKEAYELLDNVSIFTEQDLVKPYLEKLMKQVCDVSDTVVINHGNLMKETFIRFSDVIKLIENLLSEKGDTE